jgi:hypothetical protein
MHVMRLQETFLPLNTFIHAGLYGRILSFDVFNTLHVTSILSVTKATLGNRSDELAVSVPVKLWHAQGF